MMRKLVFIFFIQCSLLTTLQAQRQFWGTSSSGGLHHSGFIFKTDSIGNNLEIVHHFDFLVDGKDISALTLASNNKLYGMASAGGIRSGGNMFGGGTFFEIDLATNQFKVLQHFGAGNTALPDLAVPMANGNTSLTEISPGILYGLMSQGSHIFMYNISTGVFTRPLSLPTYNGGASNGPLQSKLNQAFIKASDGNFYVTTSTNSACPIPNPYMGSIMRMNAAGTSITTRHLASCVGDPGVAYKGTLVEVGSKLYGFTDQGGATNKGVIFEYTPATNTNIRRHSFASSVYSYYPTAMALGANGKLYGTAHGGGIPEINLGLSGGGGVLFEFDLTTNAFEVKHNFTLTGQSIYDMGIFPSGLLSATNGKLYGATQYGVFEYNTTTNTIRTAGRFNHVGFSMSLMEVCRKPYYEYREQSTISVCEGETFSFDLETPNATSVVWKHNGQPDATQTTSMLTFDSFTETNAGTWQSTLTNECGVTITQTITLQVGNPEAPTIQTNGATEFCEGESVTLIAPEDYTYTWSNGQATREIVVAESGSYTLQINNGCESLVSEAVVVTVNPLPATPVLTQSYNGGIVLIASGSSSGKYYWTYNDEPLTIQTDRVTQAQEGVYKVYSVSAANCRSAEAASITVVITGDEPAVQTDVSLYPNPTTGFIRLKNVGTGKAEVYDGSGRKVASATLSTTTETVIDLHNLPPGSYNVLIKQGDGLIVKKIVVQ